MGIFGRFLAFLSMKTLKSPMKGPSNLKVQVKSELLNYKTEIFVRTIFDELPKTPENSHFQVKNSHF